MTEAKTTAIKLPDGFEPNKDEGDTIAINFGGGPEKFTVKDGTIRVPNAQVQAVLGALPGAETVEGGTTAHGTN